jgi:hypothetical protein
MIESQRVLLFRMFVSEDLKIMALQQTKGDREGMARRGKGQETKGFWAFGRALRDGRAQVTD